MNVDISRTGSDKRWWDYRQLWNSKEARYRSMLAISIAFVTQVSPQIFDVRTELILIVLIFSGVAMDPSPIILVKWLTLPVSKIRMYHF